MDLKHWPEGRSSASCFLPSALYFAHILLPSLVFLPSSLKPVLGLGLHQNNLGTFQAWRTWTQILESHCLLADFLLQEESFTAASSLINIWIWCSFSRANSMLLGHRYYCQMWLLPWLGFRIKNVISKFWCPSLMQQLYNYILSRQFFQVMDILSGGEEVMVSSISASIHLCSKICLIGTFYNMIQWLTLHVKEEKSQYNCCY